MKLRLTPRAARNLADIADYLGERSPEAALGGRNANLESLQNLVLFPRGGRNQQADGVHKIVTRRYSYLIYYTVDETTDEIVILAIRHPARDPEHADS